MKKVLVTGLLCVAWFAHGDNVALYKQGASLYKKDPARALVFFEKAANEGNVSAMVGAGHCFETGVGTEKDYAKAIGFYESAVKAKSIKACEGLARIYASCSVPRFHDGKKAVRYASLLVKKKPLDSGYLSLLAAAHARNFEFEAAAEVLDKALRRQRIDEDLRAVYVNKVLKGMPLPPCASDEWLLRGVEQEFLWSVTQVARRLGDRAHPAYDPEQAMKMCRKAGRLGDKRFYALQGDIILRHAKSDEELGEAYECYNRYYGGEISFINKSKPVQQRGHKWLIQDADSCWEWAEKFKASESISYYDENGNYEDTRRADLPLSKFLLFLASVKGYEGAENPYSKKDTVEWDKRSSAYYENRYLKNPSARAAYDLGLSFYRLQAYAQSVFWFEQAREKGSQNAVTKLVELYACCPDPSVRDGDLAVLYIEQYIQDRYKSKMPDHNILSLQACAYARAGTFIKAEKAMRQAVEMKSSSDYKQKYTAIKKGQAWPADEIRNDEKDGIPWF